MRSIWFIKVHTVSTGPKISSLIVIDLGSFVRITVGWTKYPLESSPRERLSMSSILRRLGQSIGIPPPPIRISPPASFAFLV